MTAQAAGRPALTGREQDALDAIGHYVAAHGYPPSMRDLCAALGLMQASSVMYILNQLQGKGYLVRDPGRPRTIRILR